MMGGEIEVQSKPGIGSTFSFYVIMERSAFPCSINMEKESISGEDVKLPPLRVLVVEDNTLNQQVISTYLERHGHKFKIAVNGEEALLKLAEEQFDIVLMDVEMPVMDGLEAIRQIRENKEKLWQNNIPVILLTAHALKGDRERFLASGANDYLPKPLNFTDLEACITEVMMEQGLFVQKDDKSYADSPGACAMLLSLNENEEKSDKQVIWLDKKEALAAIENDEELLNDIFKIFLREGVENLQKLKSIDFSDHVVEKCNEARILVHSIKGSSFSIGAMHLGNQAAKIEALFKKGSFKSALSYMADFEQIFMKTVELVKNECIL
jgi:CheY-like chemotaxis protein